MGVNLKGQYPYSVIELETVGFGSKTRQTLAPSESAMTTSAKIYSVRHVGGRHKTFWPGD